VHVDIINSNANDERRYFLDLDLQLAPEIPQLRSLFGAMVDANKKCPFSLSTILVIPTSDPTLKSIAGADMKQNATPVPQPKNTENRGF